MSLQIEYIPLPQLSYWDRNPKLHDEPAIRESIRRHGFRDAPILDRTLGALVAGNGRARVLESMKLAGEPMPDGLKAGKGGEWLVPVQTGIDAPDRDQAVAFAIDHNNLTLGPDADAHTRAALWETTGYQEVLRILPEDALPITVTTEDLRTITENAGNPDGDEYGEDVEAEVKYQECPSCGHRFPK